MKRERSLAEWWNNQYPEQPDEPFIFQPNLRKRDTLQIYTGMINEKLQEPSMYAPIEQFKIYLIENQSKLYTFLLNPFLLPFVWVFAMSTLLINGTGYFYEHTNGYVGLF